MKKIKGISLIGMLGVATMVAVAGIFLIKISSVYLNYYKVKQAVSSLSRFSSDRFSHDMLNNATQIRRILSKQFNIDNIYFIKPNDIVIKPRSYKKFQIIIDFEVKEKMIANISILFHFNINEEVEINAP